MFILAMGTAKVRGADTTRQVRPSKNLRVVRGGSSPHGVTLGEEERAILRQVLRQAGIDPKQFLATLVNKVQTCMAYYRAVAQPATFRERHDALRELLRLADEEDPPIAVIRGRIMELEPTDLSDITERAERLWPRVFPGQCLGNDFDFARWSQTAPKDQLLEAVRTFVPGGAEIVPGRARPGGKRSAARLEPLILGHARGAAPSGTNAAGPLGRRPGVARLSGGRPRADAQEALVMQLAVKWHRVTGLQVQSGRSDQTPFGALVHHVFGWLGLETADQALRRYWDTVSDAEIIDIEGGQIFR
jgi:hypothetical protein